jgi:hypothetical protein
MRREIIEFRLLLRQVTVTGGYGYMILNTSTRRKGIKIILDSSAQRNFISPETIKQLNILIREKEKPYLFSVINKIVIKQDKGIVRYKTILMRVTIRRYIEEISLDIIKISNY